MFANFDVSICSCSIFQYMALCRINDSIEIRRDPQYSLVLMHYFVSLLTAEGTPVPIYRYDSEKARVLFSYEAREEDELTLKVGEVIHKVDSQDGGWWEGEIDGRRGVFPSNFVSLINKEQSEGKQYLGFFPNSEDYFQHQSIKNE